MNKFCSNCGTPVSEGVLSCPSCGKIFAADEFVDEFLPEEVAEPEVEPAEPVFTAPVGKLKTNRGLLKYILLSIITFGIYGLVVMSTISSDINTVASRYDGKRTMPYFAMYLLAPLTLGIYPLVWMHKFCGRIRRELDRRTIGWQFGPRTFWLWGVLGSLILVGPFIFCHRLMVAMNKLNGDYNING